MSELIRVSRGVWRPADQVDSLAGRLAAVLAAFPDGTVIAGVTAARLHRLWLPDWLDHTIELIVHPDQPVPRERAYNRRPGIRARRQMLHPSEITVVDGLRATSAAKCWLDLAARLFPPDPTALGDCALHGRTTLAELESIVSRARRLRGVIRAREVLPMLDCRSRSRPESHLRYALVSRGLPKPEVNEPIYDRLGQWLAEPDLSYDDVRLALEYNGEDHAEISRMRRDITRGVDVGFRGRWHSVTFGPAEVFKRPDQVASYVRELRRERARLLR